MATEVEYTDDFGAWWDRRSEDEQESVDVSVRLLEAKGIALPLPHSSDVKGSKHGNMRELRIHHEGEPYRVFYDFDPRRMAILLIGGCKTSDPRFCEKYVPKADRIYDAHVAELRREADRAAKKPAVAKATKRKR